jgi:hypothetical protein
MTRGIVVVTADAELRAYIEQCLRRIPDVAVEEAADGAAPDLVVCDAFHATSAVPSAAARLLVLDETPSPDDEEAFGFHSPTAACVRVSWIVAPFDADSLSRAALRLLPPA